MSCFLEKINKTGKSVAKINQKIKENQEVPINKIWDEKGDNTDAI